MTSSVRIHGAQFSLKMAKYGSVKDTFQSQLKELLINMYCALGLGDIFGNTSASHIELKYSHMSIQSLFSTLRA